MRVHAMVSRRVDAIVCDCIGLLCCTDTIVWHASCRQEKELLEAEMDSMKRALAHRPSVSEIGATSARKSATRQGQKGSRAISLKHDKKAKGESDPKSKTIHLYVHRY